MAATSHNEAEARRLEALRLAMAGIVPFLDDDRVIEIALNADGGVWVERVAVDQHRRHRAQHTERRHYGREDGYACRDVRHRSGQERYRRHELRGSFDDASPHGRRIRDRVHDRWSCSRRAAAR